MRESNKKISRLIMAGLISISLLAPVALASSNIINTTLGTQITANAKRVHHHKHARHHVHKHLRRHEHKRSHKHKMRHHNRRHVVHHHNHKHNHRRK